jgi:hypothetical protein
MVKEIYFVTLETTNYSFLDGWIPKTEFMGSWLSAVIFGTLGVMAFTALISFLLGR